MKGLYKNVIFGFQAYYTDPETKLRYATAEEFSRIRVMTSDVVSGCLALRRATTVVPWNSQDQFELLKSVILDLHKQLGEKKGPIPVCLNESTTVGLCKTAKEENVS